MAFKTSGKMCLSLLLFSAQGSYLENDHIFRRMVKDHESRGVFLSPLLSTNLCPEIKYKGTNMNLT